MSRAAQSDLSLRQSSPDKPGPITEATAPENVRYQRLFNLNPANIAPYAGLTFPSLAPGTNAQRRLGNALVGICARAGDEMVGLAIAERRTAEEAQVVSIKVKPEWRRKGVGRQLIDILARCLHQEGVSRVQILYQSDTEHETILEHLLLKLGWSKPIDRFLLLEGRAEQLAKAPWAKSYPIRPPYRLETWQAQHRIQAQSLAAPPSLLPATVSQTLDHNISIALLHKEQLVGWVLADRTMSTQVRYSSLFVAEAHRARARGLALLASAFQQQRAFGPPIARAGVATENDSMIRLAKRHLKPFLQSVSRAKHSELEIKSGTESKPNAPPLNSQISNDRNQEPFS